MTLPIDFHPEVEGEVRASHRWHEQSRQGLGRDFLDAIQSCLATIAVSPAIYGVALGSTRAAPVSRFSYVVYYRVLRNCVRVVAIHHTSRDPSVWQSRK